MIEFLAKLLSSVSSQQVCTFLYLTYQKGIIAGYQLNKIARMTKKNSNAPTCSVDYAFRRIGGKYKGRILWHLHLSGILRYGELRRTLPDITPKMLTQTLRELEEDNLICRKLYHEVPPRVEYTLSEIGAELIPFINHLREWGEKQIQKIKSNKIYGDKKRIHPDDH